MKSIMHVYACKSVVPPEDEEHIFTSGLLTTALHHSASPSPEVSNRALGGILDE